MKELYQTYLNQCLSSDNLSESDISELKSLQRILMLTDSEANELQIVLTSEIFKKSYDNAISNGTYEKSEELAIDDMQKNLRMPDEIAKKISEESRQHFMNLQFQKLTADRKISPEQWNKFTLIAKNLDVILDFNDETKRQLARYKYYWEIENGELPIESVDINLQKNEYCYFSGNADWLENRTVTKRINYGGPVLRFKIMKGVYYRAGSVQVQRITSEQLLEIDFGMLYVTNKRIIFVGNKKNTNIQINKILSVTPYSDGIGIEKDSGKSPILRVICDADILAMILGRVINDQHIPDNNAIDKTAISYNQGLSTFENQDDLNIVPEEVDLKNRDELFDEAAKIVVMNQSGSTSVIQRKFSIGYNRAGRIMDQLELAGIVGVRAGSHARIVLIKSQKELEEILKRLDEHF